MSSPKIQKVATTEDRSLPVFKEFDNLLEKIRKRAYSLFAGRGFGAGRELEDWLHAEREICWPAAELTEHDNAFDVKIALAGYEPKQITVTATPQELIVKAVQESEQKGPKEAKTEDLRWSEFHHEDVYRRIAFPRPVNVDCINAKFKNGILTVVAPAAEEAKKVRVSTAA